MIILFLLPALVHPGDLGNLSFFFFFFNILSLLIWSWNEIDGLVHGNSCAFGASVVVQLAWSEHTFFTFFFVVEERKKKERGGTVLGGGRRP